MRRTCLGALLCACACTFGLTGAEERASTDEGPGTEAPSSADEGGPGSSPGTMSAGSADASSGGSTSGMDDATNDGPPTAGPTDSSDEGEDTTSGDASSTGAVFDCASGLPFDAMRTVAQASAIDPPMSADPAWGSLAGAGDVAWSGDPGAGAITFEVEVPCDRTYYLWGLTWDLIHGVNSCSGVTNADAFMVSVDGGAEIQWSYGCQGCSNPDQAWTWTIVHAFAATGCVTGLWPVNLTAGTHTIRFRNLDDGDFSPAEAPNVAAIAAMAISDDVAFTPVWP